MAEKKLKLWNGRWYPYRGESAYVAAYSRADAVRLLHSIKDVHISDSEIKNYWAGGTTDCYWGNQMAGITPERGVWVVRKRGTAPERLA